MLYGRNSFRAVICWGISIFWLGIPCEAQTTWRRTYGGYGSDVGNSVRQTVDGGFIIAGSTGSFGQDGDAYVIKTDGDGLPQWTRTYGGDGVQTGVACRELPDGYAIAGTTSNGPQGGYDLYLIKTDLDGNPIWERTYGTTAWDICNDMKVTSSGFVLAGTSYIENVGDAFIVKVDFNGDTLWTRTLGGEYFDEALGVIVTSSDDIVVAGMTNTTIDDPDAFVAKVASDGSLIWSTSFGGDSIDYFHSVVETVDGGFACSGGTSSYSNVMQVFLVKVDANGDSVFQERYFDTEDSEGREIQVNSNGDFAIAAYNGHFNAGGKDMVLLLTSSTGNFILGKNYGGPDDEVGTSLQPLPDGGYIIIGTTEGYGPGLSAIYVVRSNQNGETLDDTVYEMLDNIGVGEIGVEGPAVLLFPNPASTACKFTTTIEIDQVQIFDLQGRCMNSWERPIPEKLDLHGISPGSYRVVMTDVKRARVVLPLVVQGR